MIAYCRSLQQASTKSQRLRILALQRIVVSSGTPDADSLDVDQDEEVLAEEAVAEESIGLREHPP